MSGTNTYFTVSVLFMHHYNSLTKGSWSEGSVGGSVSLPEKGVCFLVKFKN